MGCGFFTDGGQIYEDTIPPHCNAYLFPMALYVSLVYGILYLYALPECSIFE